MGNQSSSICDPELQTPPILDDLDPPAETLPLPVPDDTDPPMILPLPMDADFEAVPYTVPDHMGYDGEELINS